MAAACRRDIAPIEGPEIIRFKEMENRKGILRGLEQVEGCLLAVLDEDCPLCHRPDKRIYIEVGTEIEEKLKDLVGERVIIGYWRRWACEKVAA